MSLHRISILTLAGILTAVTPCAWAKPFTDQTLETAISPCPVGMDFLRVTVPAHTQTRTIAAVTHSKIVTSEAGSAPKQISHPSVWAIKRERVLVEPEHQAWVVVPPAVAAATVLLTPKTHEPVKPPPSDGHSGSTSAGISGETYMLTIVPARYEWRDVRVEVSPAWTEEVAAKRSLTVVNSIIDRPARVQSVEIPESYKLVPCLKPAAGAGAQTAKNLAAIEPTPAAPERATLVRVIDRRPVVQSTAPDSAPTPEGPSGYRLGSGDKVHITVYAEPDLTGDFAISGAGKISFPLIGEIDALGLTSTELQTEIADKLMPNYLKDARVNVEMLTFRPFFIMGEVAQPGEYPFSDGLTIGRAIAKASGYTYRANHKKAYVKHSGSNVEELIVDIDAAPVQPGDVVRIPERYF